MAKTSEQTCACCGVKFMGTRLENRCPDCKAAGRRPKVKLKQAPTKGVAAVEYAKRQKAEQKKAEAAAKRKARAAQLKALKEEREELDLTDGTAVHADQMASDFETPDQRQLRRRKERTKQQLDWLSQRSRKPKGYPAMTKAISETPLGHLWHSLCHADGQVNCLTRSTDVPVTDSERLLMVHFHLRLKGFAADAIAKLCPVALLKQDAGSLHDGLTGLPEVDTTDTTDTEDDPFEGLSDNQRAEALALSDAQERQRLQSLLGL